MITKLRSILIPLLGFAIAWAAIASLPVSHVMAEEHDGDGARTPPPQVAVAVSPSELFKELDTHWQAVEKAIASHEYRTLVEEGAKTVSVARRLGLRSLDEYALRLSAEGNERLKNRDYEGAALFARKVLEFSPRSSRVLLSSLPLVVETHTNTFLDQAKVALLSVGEQSDLLLRIGTALSYPLLWALTLAVYVIALITCVAAPRQLLHSLKRRMPGFLEPMAAVMLLGLFIIPIFSGVLTAIAVWGVLLILLLPEQRWVGVWAGITITLWGAIIPINENVTLYLQSSGGQATIRALNGDYAPGDAAILAEFSRSRPGDGVALYAQGVVLRRLGAYKEALLALEKADRALGAQPFATAERGVVQLQSKEIDSALELHNKAESEGLDSAQFYMNFSRLHIEKLDTLASRHYFDLAQKADASAAEEQRRREERQSAEPGLVVSDILLPAWYLYAQALQPILEAQERSSRLISTLIPMASPVVAVFIGIALVLGSFIGGGDHEGMYAPESRYSVLLRIIPGGVFVLRGHGAWGVLFAFFAVLLVFPLLGWPLGSESIFPVIQPGIPYYVGFLMLYFLLCPWIGDRQE